MANKKYTETLSADEKEVLDNYRNVKAITERCRKVNEEENYWMRKAAQYYHDLLNGKYIMLSAPHYVNKLIRNYAIVIEKASVTVKALENALKKGKDYVSYSCLSYPDCEIYLNDIHDGKADESRSEGKIGTYSGNHDEIPLYDFYNPFIPADYKWGNHDVATAEHPIVNAKILSDDEYKEEVKRIKDYRKMQVDFVNHFVGLMIPVTPNEDGDFPSK